MLLATLPALALGSPPSVAPPHLPGERVRIDGRLDEEVWARAAVVTDFVRWRPTPGTAAWLGVNETLEAEDGAGLTTRERAVFAKLSWLFRP